MKEIHIRDFKHSKEKKSIVSVVCGFESEITAVVSGQKFNAKSIMNTPMIDHAECIDFMIAGVDEEKAEKAVKKLYDMIQERMVSL